jgi:hypothetical protein
MGWVTWLIFFGVLEALVWLVLELIGVRVRVRGERARHLVTGGVLGSGTAVLLALYPVYGTGALMESDRGLVMFGIGALGFPIGMGVGMVVHDRRKRDRRSGDE